MPKILGGGGSADGKGGVKEAHRKRHGDSSTFYLQALSTSHTNWFPGIWQKFCKDLRKMGLNLKQTCESHAQVLRHNFYLYLSSTQLYLSCLELLEVAVCDHLQYYRDGCFNVVQIAVILYLNYFEKNNLSKKRIKSHMIAGHLSQAITRTVLYVFELFLLDCLQEPFSLNIVLNILIRE